MLFYVILYYIKYIYIYIYIFIYTFETSTHISQLTIHVALSPRDPHLNAASTNRVVSAEVQPAQLAKKWLWVVETHPMISGWWSFATPLKNMTESQLG